MIDIDREPGLGSNLLTLAEAAKIAPGTPKASSLWRACRKGVLARDGRRIYLDHTRFGRRLFTTRAALLDFQHALTEADRAHFQEREGGATTSCKRHPPKREQLDAAVDAAERELEEAGW